MKTKLDLFIAVENLAHETLDAIHTEAEAKITSLLKTVNLSPDERNTFSTFFYSRRQRMIGLQAQPLSREETKAGEVKK